MPSELDLVSLAGQVAKLREDEAHRWSVEYDESNLCVHVTLTPRGSIDVYCLKEDFNPSLSEGPPSVTFCDPITHAVGVLKYWPAGLTDFFKTPPANGIGWVCNPWTREGRHHHAEWRQFPWSARRAVWSATSAIQDILDSPNAYAGRAA
jgi:hypothetical protein